VDLLPQHNFHIMKNLCGALLHPRPRFPVKKTHDHLQARQEHQQYLLRTQNNGEGRMPVLVARDIRWMLVVAQWVVADVSAEKLHTL
jgi:hypothetical protein